MKNFLYLLAALLMLSVSACSRYETVNGDPLNTKIYTLDNGMKIYMSVNKEQPRIQTYMAVKVGSKNDPSETTGLAHYFEHLMFKGTENFGTSDYQAEKPLLDKIEQLFEVYRVTEDETERAKIYHQIDSVSYEASKLAIPNEYDKLMAIIGADGTNAWTSADETVYTEDIPSNQIDNWARIQADRFRNGVIRGFHTELETIYEEKNMSLTQDSRKVWEAIDQALFPHHPYGQQTTLGSQEHLKNPSITNVKNYHDVYYVPNNIAVCVSGDFDPKEMVAAIEKYFGDWEANPSIPSLEYEQEEAITEPVVKEVYGLEAENVALGWRLPGAKDLETAAVATIASNILSNGTAGLLDIDVNQQQKALYLSGGYSQQPDYSSFIMSGRPKEGQTLEQLRELALEEIAKLRNGEFSDSLRIAIINNIKLEKMQQLEDNASRAQNYVNAFISGIDWADACKEIERLSAVTKEDVIAFANKYLGAQSYALVYKRIGVDNSVRKIAAPSITPIVTNRDLSSSFLNEIKASEVKPIEPVFVDFSKDMSVSSLSSGAKLLYKHNDINDVFTVNFLFNEGSVKYPELAVATDYLYYLGTPEMSAEQLSAKLYELACSYNLQVGSYQTMLTVSGLSENMSEAVELVENLLLNAKDDEEILDNVKSDIIKSRENSQKAQKSCYNAFTKYAIYGSDFVTKSTISNKAIATLSSNELLRTLKDLFLKGHVISYYGPEKESALISALEACHTVGENLSLPAEEFASKVPTATNEVILAQYDAKQLYYFQYSNNGKKFDASLAPQINLYNEYFGNGMNTIVFQEMREARGLAYSAWANDFSPKYADDTYYYQAYIATQNDKMQQAIEAFDSIINDMPKSEAAFDVAKNALIARLRTQRTVGMSVLSSYLSCSRLGLEEPLDKLIYDKVQTMTLADVTAFQKNEIKDRTYSYCILGDIKDLDTKFLETLGPIKVVSLDELFGY